MYFKHYYWTIKKIADYQEQIDPKPQYQRGPVWKLPKKQLLIDSIINRFDIPKIYLRHVGDKSPYKYEVADGQQRLRSIWGFYDNEFTTGIIVGENTKFSNKNYTDMKKEEKKKIDSFKLIIAVAYEASNDKIRELFARLQKGDRLTPAEIRNSMPSAIGDVIRAMALTHSFFKNSPYSQARYKTDDLLSHAFAVEIDGVKNDLKAPNLADMYIRFKDKIKNSIVKKVNDNLKFMDKMQRHAPKCIRTKWGFVDIYSVISIGISSLNPPEIADRFVEWELKRKENISEPEKLLETGLIEDRKLYEYIMAFQKEGAVSKNLKLRRDILSNWLKK